MNTQIKGYALGIAAAASYGLNPLFALPLYEEGMTTSWVLFYRYMFAIPIVAVMMLIRGRDFRVSRRQLAMLAILGFLMGFSSLTLFVSYRYMEASIASTMLFVYPLMVAIIMAIVYRERLSYMTWACMAVAGTGLVLLTQGHDGTVSATGVIWVIVSALTYAVYLVLVGRPLLQSLGTLKLSFYVLSFGFLIFIFNVVSEGEVQVPGNMLMWGEALGLALFPTAVSLLCTTVAIGCIGSTPTAILGVFEPVTGVIVGVGVFGEVLTAGQVVGLVLILAAVSLVVGGESVSDYIVSIRKMLPSRRCRRHDTK